MELRYADLDARFDAVQDRFWTLDADRRAEWAKREHAAWLYHELQLEGVSARLSDITRALQGEKGADYCDRVLLDQIRQTDALLQYVRAKAQQETRLTIAALRQWVSILQGHQQDVVFRTKDGATEQYKHDVAPPEEIVPALERLFESKEKQGGEHPLETAFEQLYSIGKIWPFPQWSGTCARMAASSVLIGVGYPPLIVPVRERMAYYQGYHHEPTRMKDLFLEVIGGIFTSKEAFTQNADEALMPLDAEDAR